MRGRSSGLRLRAGEGPSGNCCHLLPPPPPPRNLGEGLRRSERPPLTRTPGSGGEGGSSGLTREPALGRMLWGTESAPTRLSSAADGDSPAGVPQLYKTRNPSVQVLLLVGSRLLKRPGGCPSSTRSRTLWSVVTSCFGILTHPSLNRTAVTGVGGRGGEGEEPRGGPGTPSKRLGGGDRTWLSETSLRLG